MNFFVASVGAKSCVVCHNPRDFASDELPKKSRVREMIRMVQKINQRFFKDERLTCYTCHRGNPFPKQVLEKWSPLIVKAMEEDEAFTEEVREAIDGVLELNGVKTGD